MSGQTPQCLIPTEIARTAQWLVLNKPAGWLTIPGRDPASAAPILSSWLEQREGQKIWVVHRIDRETSGLVLLARTAEAHRLACGWFERRQIKKSYDFLGVGNPTAPILRINSTIQGSPSLTQVEVRERFGNAFLGRATPLTGRRHQIRIHLAAQGHPLLGDVQYGGPKEWVCAATSVTLQISRVALHAARLAFATEVFEAPWADDFKEWVETLCLGKER